MPRNHRGGDRRRGGEPRGERPGRAERGERTEVFGKTKLCKFHILGVCSKGSECNFAHDSAEMHALPDLSRTKICKTLINTGKCEDPDCRYAHSREELRNIAGGFSELSVSKVAAAQCQPLSAPAPGSGGGTPAPCPTTPASNAAFAQAFAQMATQELQASYSPAPNPQVPPPYAHAASSPQAQAALLQHMAAQLSLQAAMIQAQQPPTSASSPDMTAQLQMQAALMHASLNPGWSFPPPSFPNPPQHQRGQTQQPDGNVPSARPCPPPRMDVCSNGARRARGGRGAGRGGGGGSSLAWLEEQRGDGVGHRTTLDAPPGPPADACSQGRGGRVARSTHNIIADQRPAPHSSTVSHGTRASKPSAASLDLCAAMGVVESSASTGPLSLDQASSGGAAASPAAAPGGGRKGGRAGRMAVVNEAPEDATAPPGGTAAKRVFDRFDSDDSTAVPSSEKRLQDCASVETTPQDTPTLGPLQLPAATAGGGMGGDSPSRLPAARPRAPSGTVMDDADFRASLGVQSVTVKNTFLDFQSHQPSPQMPGMRQVQTAAGRLDLMAQSQGEQDDEG